MTKESYSTLANCWLRFTGGFAEGFDTRDLKEAKALLEELAASSLLIRPVWFVLRITPKNKRSE